MTITPTVRRRSAVVAVALTAVFLSCCASPPNATGVPDGDRDLWWLVDQAEQNVPLTIDKTQDILGIPLKQVSDQRWRGDKSVELSSKLTVQNVESFANDNDKQRLTFFMVSTRPCITKADVESRYSTLERYYVSPHNPHFKEGWAQNRAWGKLIFLIGRGSGCVAEVSLVDR
ncbi:hypothetical protein DSM43276_04212 [Mycobacteroides salmoniphilum]|uniref:hypothetical protein n=1 Tax=Mycobacteroides salmoniphilum TaxID=404941 RepID=UPI0010C4E306|nr:hypothetical protein [Mycobacteroides salmoniphilum]QCH25925.1 hypothetical protein DSM43276_04212 [Mycobacteroides salmoniphilum]